MPLTERFIYMMNQLDDSKDKNFNKYRLNYMNEIAKYTIDNLSLLDDISSIDNKFYKYDLPIEVYRQSEVRSFLYLNQYICNINDYFDSWERTEWSNEERKFEKAIYQDREAYQAYQNHQPFREGWKFHIALDTYSDYLFAVQHVLPELRRLQLNHKIVSVDKWELLNRGELNPLQIGKNITIYITSILLFKLQSLSKQVKLFLNESTELNISTDKHIGGRLFARYSGFFDDKVFNPITNQRMIISREEGLYKPKWIPELLSFNELLYSTKNID